MFLSDLFSHRCPNCVTYFSTLTGLHKAKIIFISVRRAAVILGLLSLNAFAEGSKTGGELILLFSASCDLFSSVFFLHFIA